MVFVTVICDKLTASEKARIVTQRVPFGELYEFSELSLPVQLTENAESDPPGVFSFSPVFRAVCGIKDQVRNVSVSRRSLSGCGRYATSAPDFWQNSLTLWLARVVELTHSSLSGC